MKVLVCDDEPLARARLERMVESVDGMNLVGSASNGAELFEGVESLNPDIVLLDIHLPGENGLDLAAQLGERENPPAIIFCSAYDHYALKAFEVNAVDYLLKPVTAEALEKALLKSTQLSRTQIEAFKEYSNEHDEGDNLSHLTVKVHNGIRVIPLHEVVYLMADRKYVRVVSVNGEALMEISLKALEEQLGDRFRRVHRNALVNFDRVLSLKKQDNQMVVELRGCEECIPVSRRHLQSVRTAVKSLS